MANPVIMPRQGQSVESCIISNWFKNEGDEIKKGDMLFSYETDKAAFECESEFAGVLLKRLYQEGDEVPVLKIVAIIGKPGESIDQFSDESVDSTHEGMVSVESKEEEDFTPTNGLTVARLEGEKIKISPRARKKAKGLGINYEGIGGSGPEGRIIEQDVILAAKTRSFTTPLAKAIANESGKTIPSQGTGIGNRVTSFDLLSPAPSVGEEFEIRKLSNMRKIIAAKMKESLQNSAQLTHHTSADARRLLELRKKAKESFEKGASENITINDMVCFAVIRALKKHPMVNCHLLGDTISIFHKVHLGLAVDTDRGLMVPTVKNADDLSIQGLAAQLKAVANSCKKGNINPELLASEAATFSVSNLGSYGVELFTPVINLPQVAILGVNTIINRPTDLGNGVFGFVPFIGLSLTYDHRALDGAPASAFLREIRLEIENLDFTV
ncbi:MAG: dihydrolipoamide acetyltransferase family protein [Bacteroidales bacterium]